MDSQEWKGDIENIDPSIEATLPLTDPKELYDAFKEMNSMEQPSQPSTLEISKRPFCNGFTGCGRFGKRRLRLIRQRFPIKVLSSQVKKRPFCNGFFGCGNGKRTAETELTPDTINDPQKKLFCNPMSGCSNAGKRYASFLNRLRQPKHVE